MNLRFAFSTASYGRRFHRITDVLDEVADAGFRGIEFAQAPNMLGVTSHTELEKLCLKRELQILGYSGGTLQSRMDFCGKRFSGYLSIDFRDEDGWVRAMHEGFRLALHPHTLHQMARVEDTAKYLAKYSQLQLLPDTGHMGINGEKLTDLLGNKLLPRLAAIHLKDWESHYGRHSHRYARGFVPLGQGCLAQNIRALLIKLSPIPRPQPLWCVAEVDTPRTTEHEAALACASWLREEGYAIASERTSHPTPRPASTKVDLPPCPWSAVAEGEFTNRLLGVASREPRRFYQEIADAFADLFPCQMTEVRVFLPLMETLELAGWSGSKPKDPYDWNHAKGYEQVLSPMALRGQPVNVLDLPMPDFDSPSERSAADEILFPAQEWLDTKRHHELIALPVNSAWNAQDLRFLVTVLPDPEAPERIIANSAKLHLERLGTIIARAADLMLDERWILAAGEMLFDRDVFKTSQEFYVHLRKHVTHILDCEGVAVFAVKERGPTLELVSTTGTHWRDPEKPKTHHYKQTEGHTGGWVWSRNAVWYNRYDLRDRETKRPASYETTASTDRDECLMMPISRHAGYVLGVIRCTNRRNPLGVTISHMFSDDDIAALDSLVQAALPQLELLLQQERHLHDLRRLLHEFHVPNIAIRSCVQLMQHEFKHKGGDAAKFFKEDYLDDVWSYTELMGRHLANAMLFEADYRQTKPKIEQPIAFRKEVVHPAVAAVRLMLKDRQLPKNAIKIDLPDKLQKLWIDRNQWQTVMFNLLTNAIKHSGEPHKFRVDVRASIIEGHLQVSFSDWGQGISEADAPHIFEEGFRGSETKSMSVTGQGLGLAIVSEIVSNHDGSIQLTGLHNPTIFEIILPVSLFSSKPSICGPA